MGSFGWCHGQAKVQIADQSLEYLVTLSSPRPCCTSMEMEDMCWPYEHLMAWENVDDRDSTEHFHTCWKTSSLRKLYEPYLPCFLSNDLESRSTCFPPLTSVKKGRNRVVHIKSGGRRCPELGPDEFIDENGNHFFRYQIEDDPELMDPMPTRKDCAEII